MLLMQFKLVKASDIYKILKILIAHLQVFSKKGKTFLEGNSLSSSLRSIQNHNDKMMRIGEINVIK